MAPPFRAEHIGSLKRPQKLLDLKEKWEADPNSVSPEEMKKVEDECIIAAVEMQKRVGLKAITDGEYRRHMFFNNFFDNLDGMECVLDPPLEIFKAYVPDVAGFINTGFRPADTWLCKSKLKRTKPMYRHEFEFLKTLVAPEDVKNIKITLCAPEWFHLRHGEHAYDHSVYKNDEEYFRDIGIAYQEELKDLYEAGCRNVQFDDPLLAYFCAVSMLEGMKAVGVDSEAVLTTYLNAYNWVLDGRPKDLHVGLHLCRGNYKGGKHFSEGGYEHIAKRLFNEVDVDTFYLEYDTERAGTFDPLIHLPPKKKVILGLISSKLPQLENISDLEKRLIIGEAFLGGKDRVGISPQCGFASHKLGNNVTEEDVEKKLSLVVQTANAIWGGVEWS